MAPSSQKHKLLGLGVGLAVSALCLWLAMRGMLKDPGALRQIGNAFRTADYRLLLPYWLGLFLFYWLKSWRWRLLLRPMGDFQPLPQLFPPILIGFAFNNLFPAHLGELVRVFVFSRRHRVRYAAALTSVALERVFDILAIVAFLALGLFFVDGLDPSVRRSAMIGGAAATTIAAGAVVFVTWTQPFVRVFERLLGWAPFLPAGLRVKAARLLETAAAGLTSLHNPALVAGIVVTSLAQWAINGWMIHLSLISFGIHVSLWVSCIVLGVVAFGVTIPASPGYFGVIQLCFMSVLKLFTEDQEAVFAASVFYQLAQYIPVTLIGLFFFNRTGLKMAQVDAVSEELPADAAAGAVDCSRRETHNSPCECESAHQEPRRDLSSGIEFVRIKEHNVAAENVVIIGSGPAGWAAAIYTARANLKPVLFEGAITSENQAMGTLPLGQLALTTEVENYPGFPAGNLAQFLDGAIDKEKRQYMGPHSGHGVSGPELMELMRQQAVNFGTRVITDDIVELDASQRPFRMKSLEGKEFVAHSVIVATGARANYLGLPSEDQFKNRGVSACAVCDGALPRFRDKPLVVVGGGDSAMEEATYLTKFSPKVYIVHRRNEFRASKIMADRTLGNPRINVKWNSVVEEVLGDDEKGVTGVRIKTSPGDTTETLEAAGYFAAIGHTPNTDFLKGQLQLTEKKYIVWTKPFRTFTSVEGIFAAGDVADDYYRQAITAAGSGCMSALDCERWLATQGID